MSRRSCYGGSGREAPGGIDSAAPGTRSPHRGALFPGPTDLLPDGREPVPGGWNRVHIQVNNIEAEVKRLREAGLKFRNDIISGPGGSQILLDDPSGNPVELFQPAI